MSDPQTANDQLDIDWDALREENRQPTPENLRLETDYAWDELTAVFEEAYRFYADPDKVVEAFEKEFGKGVAKKLVERVHLPKDNNPPF